MKFECSFPLKMLHWLIISQYDRILLCCVSFLFPNNSQKDMLINNGMSFMIKGIVEKSILNFVSCIMGPSCNKFLWLSLFYDISFDYSSCLIFLILILNTRMLKNVGHKFCILYLRPLDLWIFLIPFGSILWFICLNPKPSLLFSFSFYFCFKFSIFFLFFSSRLSRYAVESYLEQILSHGFFHADPVRR